MMNFLKLRWLFNKRAGMFIFYGMLLCTVAGMVNVVGIKITGDVQKWSLWLKEQAHLFLVWRLILYAGVGYGWWWMRQRVIQREEKEECEKNKQNEKNEKSMDGEAFVREKSQTPARTRFIRIEIAAVCALLMLEISQWLT